MNHTIQRAQILLSQSRFPEAIAEIRKGLAERPNEPFMLAMLSQAYLANRDFKEGLQAAEMAISQNVESPFLFLTLGKAQFYNKQIEKAKNTLQEGLSLDPTEADFFYWIGQIDFYEENWEMALDAVNQGLELDAEDVPLLNLRTQALIKLNRQADAQETVDDALHRNPENSYSHANKGYSLLHSGDLDASLAQFKEALRLDPTNDFAREGLKEAIKGKNPIYRGIQKYFLWMGRMQSKYQWGFIIGIYVLYQVILRTMDAYPALYPFLLPLAIFYVIFAFSTWIAQPISNLALRFHPLGKLALDDDEKLASNLVGFLGILMLVALGMYFTGVKAPFYDDYYMYVAGFFGLSMIPVSGMFSVPKETKARSLSTLYTLFLLACGIGFLATGLEYEILFIIFALGIFVYSFVVNYLMQMSSKEF